MAAGVPLVTTRVGQATELVRDGQNGLLADVDDVDALAAAVERVHTDRELRARLRAAGRETAEAHAEERLDARWARLLDGFVRPCGISRYARAARRWARLLLLQSAGPGLRLFYGHDLVPGPGEPVAGGWAKFQRLAARFPNNPTDFTVLYLGSTWLPRDLGAALALARQRGASRSS